jgi:ABC-2 type transport system ATP-binding protein
LGQGAALGLLGLNGAGKTSTIRALMGMLKPRAGTISVFGGRPGSPVAFRRIGFAPENALPPEYLTATEYLRFVGAFRIKDRAKRKEAVEEVRQWFDLAEKKKIREYSKGMVRRLVLAQAFLGNPELLILDEPLNGLDPLVIIKLRERLEAYRKQGGTVLFSSHILAEVEKTCTDVAILSAGKLVHNSSLEVVLEDFGSVETAFASKVGGPV